VNAGQFDLDDARLGRLLGGRSGRASGMKDSSSRPHTLHTPTPAECINGCTPVNRIDRSDNNLSIIHT
jgi:hypothetical protein